MDRSGRVRQAWLGVFRYGKDGSGKFWQVWHGKDWLGVERFGAVRQAWIGVARRGRAKQAWSVSHRQGWFW